MLNKLLLDKNIKIQEFADVAQSVEQLIRNR